MLLLPVHSYIPLYKTFIDTHQKNPSDYCTSPTAGLAQTLTLRRILGGQCGDSSALCNHTKVHGNSNTSLELQSVNYSQGSDFSLLFKTYSTHLMFLSFSTIKKDHHLFSLLFLCKCVLFPRDMLLQEEYGEKLCLVESQEKNMV